MRKISLLLITSILLSACSARQEGPNFRGSTEQRLVTQSIHGMVKTLKADQLTAIHHKRVHLVSHFVIDNQVVKYAHERLKLELLERFHTQVVADTESADYKLDMFYTSLGTDRDSTGLSVPIVNLSDPEQSTIVPILAIDMYHGISSGDFYLTDLKTGTVVKKGKIHYRSRSDKFSTPFFSFPVSTIDE